MLRESVFLSHQTELPPKEQPPRKLSGPRTATAHKHSGKRSPLALPGRATEGEICLGSGRDGPSSQVP